MPSLPEPSPSPALRAVDYRRVSTDDQANEGYSLGQQAERNADFIRREGWTHVGSYEDAGVSGAAPRRPAADRMLADLAAGAFDVLVLTHLDRLGRDAVLLGEWFRLFDAAGVQIVAAGARLERETPEGRLHSGILSQFAEFEREKIRGRTRDGIRGRVAAGKPWGTPLFPYRWVAPLNEQWEPDPAQVRIAERIDHEFLDLGHPFQTIARHLNGDGIRGVAGGKWAGTTVKNALTSRARLGEFQHPKGVWHKGTHDPLIERERWEAIQALVAHASSASRGPRRGGRRPRAHLFTNGLLRCFYCNETMIPRSDTDSYYCRTNKVLVGGGACLMPRLPRAEVDASALDFFERTWLDLDGTRARLAAGLDDQAVTVERQIEAARHDDVQASERLARVEADYLSGALGAESYERLRPPLSEQSRAAKEHFDALVRHLDDLRRSLDGLDAEGETLRRLGALRAAVVQRVRDGQQQADVEALRAAMAHSFGFVVVGPEGRIYGVGASLEDESSAELHGVGLPLRGARTTDYETPFP